MAEIKNSQKFKTVTTNLGRNAVALAHGSGSSVRFTHMAVGDGKGKEIEPIATMTELVHEVHRGAINDIIILEDKPGEFIAELLIPQNIGGFFIREVGLFLEDGTLFAIGSTPLTEKTEITSGAASDLLVRMIIRIIDSGVIEIVIDPTQVLATRDYVDRSIQKGIDKHNKDENAHKPLLDKIKELIASAGQSLQTHLKDPNAHKSLFDSIKGQISAIPKISLANIITPTDTTKAVTGKAVADYAVGKNEKANIVANKTFINKTDQQLILPFKHNNMVSMSEDGKLSYTNLEVFDKNSDRVGFFTVRKTIINTNLAGMYVQNSSANGGKSTGIYVEIGKDNTIKSYAPTPPDNDNSNQIATTGWVKTKGGGMVSLKGTRTTLGDWTITNLIINKPVFIMGDNPDFPSQTTASFGAIMGVISGATTGRMQCYIGHLGGLNGFGSNALIVIPDTTKIVVNVRLLTGEKTSIKAFQ